MKYTVVWKQDAEAELAQIWTDASDRTAVRSAADQFDTSLSENPLAIGESRLEKYRIAFFLPLGFEFRVVEQDRRVFVVRVWRVQ